MALPGGGQEKKVAPPLLFYAVFPVRANLLKNFLGG